MSSAHRIAKDLFRAATNRNLIVPDPGDAGTIAINRSPAVVEIVTAGVETRTLADPSGAGQTCTLTLKTDGGTCTVTASSPIDQTGNTVLTFDDVNDSVHLYSILDGTNTYAWRLSSGATESGVEGITGLNLEDPSPVSIFDDDFFRLDTTLSWDETSDGTPGFATIDSDTLQGGVVELKTQPSTPLNNNEVYVTSLREDWVFLAAKKLWFEARVQLTEANVDDANLVIGLTDKNGANSLLDNGGGPPTTYDGALFFKVDGGTVWQFETSNAGNQVTNASVGAFTSATWHTVGFYFDGTETTSTITPYLDGVAGTAHDITLSGLQAMHVMFGLKCGADTQIETLLVDYIKVLQLR